MLLFRLTLYFYTNKESIRWLLSNNEDACDVCRSIYITIYNVLSVKTQRFGKYGRLPSIYVVALAPLSPPPIFTCPLHISKNQSHILLTHLTIIIIESLRTGGAGAICSDGRCDRFRR